MDGRGAVELGWRGKNGMMGGWERRRMGEIGVKIYSIERKSKERGDIDIVWIYKRVYKHICEIIVGKKENYSLAIPREHLSLSLSLVRKLFRNI